MSRNLKITILIIIGLAVFSLNRLVLFILYYDKFGSYPLHQIISAFLNGVRFDAAMFFAFTALFWALMLIPVRSQIYYKIITWVLFPIYLTFACILGGDTVYYAYVSRHMANELFVMGNEIGFMFDMLKSYWLLITACLIIFIILAFFWRKLVNINIKPYKSYKTAIVSVIFWVAFVFIGIRGNFDDKPISTIDAFTSGDTNLGNLTLNGIFSSFKFYANKSGHDEKKYSFYDDYEAQNIIDSYKNITCSKPAEFKNIKKPNIVFILLESWSAYYVDSFSNNNFGITPNLDALAAKSIKFNRHYSPEKRSITSIQAALTGVPPMEGLPSLGFGLETMVIGNVGKILKNDGYDTIFMQTSRRRSFYMDSIAQSLGFESYYGMEDAKIILNYPDKNSSKFGWDYELYMLLADKLNVSKKPFFAFLFTGTTHIPYAELPSEFMKFPHDKEGENGLKNTFVYADWSLGEFFKRVEKEEWFDNTIFIISADHNAGKFEKTQYPEDFRVPLLIYSPKLARAYVVDNITSHSDITPTIIDLAGLFDNETSKRYLGDSIFCKDDKSFAVTSEWNSAGIITKNEYLQHSFGNILDFAPKDMSDAEKSRLEKLLLSFYQIGFRNTALNNKVK